MKSPLRLVCIAVLTILSVSLLGAERIFDHDNADSDSLPKIQSNIAAIDIRDGKKYRKSAWNLAPHVKPDVYKVGLINGKAHHVTFITDVDSISFLVELGKKYDFIIHWEGKLCYQQLVGELFEPAVIFDEEYILNNKGKIAIQIPEAYELINIALAISDFGRANKNFIYQKSDYYQEVLKWFDSYSRHELVKIFDSILNVNKNYYARLKMNGYSFVFNDKGELIRNPNFNRSGFRDQRTNNLLPYFEQIKSFAVESKFREFYAQNHSVYQQQINVYRDSINIPEMQNWLERNFPGSNGYDYYNIIFSPLVSYNQSSTWFEDNGFKELQPHVNFPYPQDFQRLQPISKNAEYISRGDIVFTEVNHGYINPEFRKYEDRMIEAARERHIWVDSSMSNNYYRGHYALIEYMNWGLISLRILDYVPVEEQEKLISRIERTMVRGRGFTNFEAFNQYLIKVYKNRPDGKSLAELFPEIISWYEEQSGLNKSKRGF